MVPKPHKVQKVKLEDYYEYCSRMESNVFGTRIPYGMAWIDHISKLGFLNSNMLILEKLKAVVDHHYCYKIKKIVVLQYKVDLYIKEIPTSNHLPNKNGGEINHQYF
jgi:hypothetical protein